MRRPHAANAAGCITKARGDRVRQLTSPPQSVLYFLHADHLRLRGGKRLGSTSLTTAVAWQLYDARRHPGSADNGL